MFRASCPNSKGRALLFLSVVFRRVLVRGKLFVAAADDLNCWIDPPRFHRMASISRGLCSTNDTRFTTIPARPVHAGSSFVRSDSISLGWSQASCNRRPILAHPQYRVRSIRSHISVQAPRLSNRNQHHSRNGDVPVYSASSAARPMPHLWHSGSSARRNEHKLATSWETEHWLHPVLLHETSRFPYVFRPFTRVQLPMPQVFGVAAPLSRRL